LDKYWTTILAAKIGNISETQKKNPGNRPEKIIGVLISGFCLTDEVIDEVEILVADIDAVLVQQLVYHFLKRYTSSSRSKSLRM